MTKSRLIEIMQEEIGLSGRPEMECFNEAANAILTELRKEIEGAKIDGAEDWNKRLDDLLENLGGKK